MRFNLIGSEIKVAEFRTTSGQLQFIQDHKLFLNFKVISENTDCVGSIFNDEYLCITDNNYKQTIINLRTSQISFPPSLLSIGGFRIGTSYISYLYNESFSEFEVVLYNFTSNTLTGYLGLKKFFAQNVIGDNYIYIDNNCLISFSISKKTPIWQHNLSHLGLQPGGRAEGQTDKFYKFLGVKENMAFILSFGGRIVVINTDDGNLIKVIYNQSFPSDMADAFMHPDEPYIYCLAYRFVKINTQTLEIETIKQIGSAVSDPMDNVTLYNIKSSSLQGQYISFTSFTRYRSFFAKWIGLFDYKTETIICYQEILPAESQLGFPPGISPQLDGNKLYILDTDKVLHIMEQNEEAESDAKI